jgi:hypothetical protein
MNGSAVGVETRCGEPRQLTTGGRPFARGLHEQSEIRRAGVNQPLGFGNGQIACTRRIDTLKWINFSPSQIGIYLLIVEGVI